MALPDGPFLVPLQVTAEQWVYIVSAALNKDFEDQDERDLYRALLVAEQYIPDPTQAPWWPTVSTVEIGEIRHFMRQSLPDGWLLCDGSTVLVADYPALAAVLPASLVSGDDITLPNLVERVLHGAATAGNVGGANSATLQDFNLPPHRHRYNGGLPVFLPLDFGTIDNSGTGAQVPTRNRTLEATVTDTQDTVQSFLDVIPVNITPAHVTALPGIYAGGS